MTTPEKQRKIFNLFSKNGDQIQTKDIPDMLRFLGYIPTNINTTEELVTYEQFLEICKDQPVFDKDELRRLFKTFDEKNDGTISVKDFFEILDYGEGKFLKYEKDEIMNYLSPNLSGVVNYQSFVDEM